MVLKDFKLQGEQMICITNNMNYNGVFYREVHVKQKTWN